VTGRAALVRV